MEEKYRGRVVPATIDRRIDYIAQQFNDCRRIDDTGHCKLIKCEDCILDSSSLAEYTEYKTEEKHDGNG